MQPVYVTSLYLIFLQYEISDVWVIMLRFTFSKGIYYICFCETEVIFFCISQRGFVEANVDDGLLEIFGLKQGWHVSFVMVELISAKHIAQVGWFFSHGSIE